MLLFTFQVFQESINLLMNKLTTQNCEGAMAVWQIVCNLCASILEHSIQDNRVLDCHICLTCLSNFRLACKVVHTYGEITASKRWNGGKTQVCSAVDCTARSDTHLYFHFKDFLEETAYENS